MLIDTHCHVNLMIKKGFDIPLNDDNFEKATIIAKDAAAAGVTKIINVGTSIIESTNCIALAKKNDLMYAAVGIHPSDLTSHWVKDLKTIEEFIQGQKANKVVAIGECGIDLYHHKHNLSQQKDLFKAQIELSLKYQLPLTIHMRDATDEVASCLEAFRKENIRGVIHCFSGDQAFANYVFELGFLIGIGGIVTYPKNETLREVVLNSPLEKIILETDAPFLPPQVYRGKQNHPKYIADIAQYIANLTNISFEKIADQTTSNAFGLFGLDNKL